MPPDNGQGARISRNGHILPPQPPRCHHTRGSTLPRPLLAALAALPALAACSLGPADPRPDTQGVVAAAWRADTPNAAPVWPSADWWTGFNSPELNTLIAQARTANFDILAAAARIRQALRARSSASNAFCTANDHLYSVHVVSFPGYGFMEILLHTAPLHHNRLTVRRPGILKTH